MLGLFLSALSFLNPFLKLPQLSLVLGTSVSQTGAVVQRWLKTVGQGVPVGIPRLGPISGQNCPEVWLHLPGEACLGSSLPRMHAGLFL
jgi:hypothetical protein